MTWAKYGTEFYDQLAESSIRDDLNDAAQLTHTQAIHHIYSTERMDLTFKKRNLLRFASSPMAEEAAAELVRVGLWKDHGDTYEVVHHADVIRQSLAAQQKKRANDKRRQRDNRAQAKGNVRADIANDVANGVAATQSVSQSYSQAGISEQRNTINTETGEVGADLDPDDAFAEYQRKQDRAVQ